ncbi:MAG: hypothetical protein KDK99_12445 [Verrucomicrobiales bacterium]|nr:hypothetical protein [Verrucomicrobiales bacterium]
MTGHPFQLELARCSALDVEPFSAEIALGGEWSLYNLAEFILKTVGFRCDHSFEFCDNLKNPFRSKERYSLFADMGEEDDPNDLGVHNTPVSTVFHPRTKMLFMFDYGDDWRFLITCTAVKESPAKRRFKKVLSTTGTPPEQYPEPEE